MAANFHEHYVQSEVKPPTERSTGLVLAGAAAVVALLWRQTPSVLWTAGAVAALLSVLSLVRPALLKPVNVLWFRLALLLHRIVSPLVMLAMFAVVFVPAGLLMRLLRDPLRLRRRPADRTYWRERKAADGPPASMANQF
jgi:hypothetical protein